MGPLAASARAISSRMPAPSSSSETAQPMASSKRTAMLRTMLSSSTTSTWGPGPESRPSSATLAQRPRSSRNAATHASGAFQLMATSFTEYASMLSIQHFIGAQPASPAACTYSS